MEKQPRYVLMMSLQEIALRRIAVALWNESHILALIGKFRFHHGKYQKEWREIVESKVTDKLSKLQLPESITKQMIRILKPIGLHILRWKLFHESFLTDSTEDLDVHILKKLCCTTLGTVNYRKTAEALVCSGVVDIVKRYQLACLYCLEDYIPVFWNELPEENKMYFYNEEDTTPIEEPRLWFCWPYILKGEEYKLDYVSRSYGYQTTFHQFAFEYSAIRGNKAASEYFLQKLTREEKESSLIRAAQGIVASVEMHSYPDAFPKEKVSEVLCYLLSLMTSEQQIQNFKENPFGFLKCFLDWPWQDLFLDNADLMWALLLESDYCYIWNMTKSIQNSDFPELFQDFFQRSPDYLRRHFLDLECQLCPFPRAFFNFDTETIKVIFKNVDAADREKFVTSERVFIRFYDFIWSGRWQWLEVCLREAKLSKEDKGRLKDAFMGFLRRIDRGQIEWWNPKWRRFFEFLDETDASAQSKRSSDDETLTQAKKLCFEKE